MSKGVTHLNPSGYMRLALSARYRPLRCTHCLTVNGVHPAGAPPSISVPIAMANACTTFVGLSGSSAGRCQSELRVIAYGSRRISRGACLGCVTCGICVVNISIPVKPAAEQSGIPRSLRYVYFAQSPSRPVHISSKYLPSCHRWANIDKRSAW